MKSKKLFSGICEVCGKVYEARSASDNLQGLQFNCKQLYCNGKVQLQEGQSQVLHFPQGKLDSKLPRRFC